jgi:GntR family transcriptional repressor for pyruvate dehydrogenase complex
VIKKVKTQTLYEQVEEQIRNMILNGAYRKGDLLPSEKDLMDMTGVSRITVREAIRGLAEVGIIETRKGKGSIVLIDGNELLARAGMEESTGYRRNFELATETRLLIEPEIARQAALLATNEEIAYLEQCLIQGEKKKRTGSDVESHLEDFHRGILKILDNPVLAEFFDSLTRLEANERYTTLVPPGRQMTVSQELHAQHYKIFEAIKEHNGEFAYFYMKEHMLYLKNTYTKYFDNFFL